MTLCRGAVCTNRQQAQAARHSRQQRRQACRDNGSPFVLAKAVGRGGLLLMGLRSHFVASYYAAPLLIANGHEAENELIPLVGSARGRHGNSPEFKNGT
jgi:hypothetical protein